jgi:hypothetical protein
MINLGIFGYKGHGKDSVGEFLRRSHGYTLTSFARPLKTMLQVGLGLTSEQTDGALKEVVDPRYGVTPRHLMQTLGTEWGRDCVSKDIWVQATRQQLLDSVAPIAVTDVRFVNEAEMILSLGGFLLYVDRPGVNIDSSHPSEQGVHAILERYGAQTFHLTNDGTLDDLEVRVALTLSAINGCRVTLP